MVALILYQGRDQESIWYLEPSQASSNDQALTRVRTILKSIAKIKNPNSKKDGQDDQVKYCLTELKCEESP